MRVGVIDKHGAPIPLLSLIRTLTVGLRVSLSQPPTGCVRVADYNRRFEITSTPITTDAQSTTDQERYAPQFLLHVQWLRFERLVPQL